MRVDPLSDWVVDVLDANWKAPPDAALSLPDLLHLLARAWITNPFSGS